MSMHQVTELSPTPERADPGIGFWRARSGCKINPDSAVEGEAQDKAQAFRSERNGPYL
jgi:hypothetical protein